MVLTSKFFRNDPRLQAAAVSDPHHILLGAVGPHVQKIQSALILIERAVIDPTELRYWLYGRSTANAVLAYKRKRRIINYRYQTQADDIVGKMTIASLDREMVAKESLARPPCNCGPKPFHLLLAFSVDNFVAPPAPEVFRPPPPLHLYYARDTAPKAIQLAQSTLDVLKAITDGTMRPADSAALATEALKTHYLCTVGEVFATAGQVKGQLEAIIGVLKNAETVFVLGVPGDPDGENAYAYSRNARDGKIYINPSFALLGRKLGARLILVHEGFHALSQSNVDWCHNPDSDAGKGYRAVRKDLRLKNAYCLSQFVLHIHLKAEKTLNPEADTVADLAP